MTEDLVFSKADIERVLTYIRRAYFSSEVHINGKAFFALLEAYGVLSTQGEDAHEWAVNSEYGYCPDCDGERACNEGYL